MTCIRAVANPNQHTDKSKLLLTLALSPLRITLSFSDRRVGGRRSYSKNTHVCVCMCVWVFRRERSYLCKTGDHRSAQIFSTACPVSIVPRAKQTTQTLPHLSTQTHTPLHRDQKPNPTPKTTHPSRANQKQIKCFNMVYESDFYTTRRPYSSRPVVSSYSVTVRTYTNPKGNILLHIFLICVRACVDFVLHCFSCNPLPKQKYAFWI